jgi:hypothetical protein
MLNQSSAFLHGFQVNTPEARATHNSDAIFAARYDIDAREDMSGGIRV